MVLEMLEVVAWTNDMKQIRLIELFLSVFATSVGPRAAHHFQYFINQLSRDSPES